MVTPQTLISAEDRLDAIDRVNRLNADFDNWNLEAMVAAFSEDGVVNHPRGVIAGHDALRRFYEGYRPLTTGVRRHSLNHVIDANDDGTLTVRHYMLLVRVALTEDAETVRGAPLTENADGLPALFMHSIVTDRLRKDERHGWRFVSRDVDATVANSGLRPPS